MNYIVDSDIDSAWIDQQQADSLAALSLQYINGVYNPYGIYFINPAGPCSPPAANLIPTELQGIETIRDVEEGAKHEDGIDIYISEGEDNSAEGFAFEIPNQYLAIQGWDEDTGKRAGQTPVVIHELGHCLGLMHPHEGDCDEASACSNSCYCTGDYICDLPSSSNNVACTVPVLGTNYMSYTTQNICRNSFTPEQLLRMRAYLSNAHDSIQAAIIPVLEFPGGTLPSGPSNSIVVSAGELHITSTLEMLPGAYIKVRAGATLRVNAKITAACGRMWRGIIVEGNNTVSQATANQGRVIVNNNGIIEHAACGIEARRVGENGSAVFASGGGIVQVIGGTFLNNSTGIRFGSYPNPNVSYIQFGDFYTDEGYRAEEITPIHLELINITGLKLNACEFKDYRTDCGNPGKRAIGINSLDASFRAEALCRFENLQTGIFASNLAANTGSFVANNNRFKACNKGIATSSMSDFFIENNDFLVQLALAETYPADYRLARHYFFAGEFDKYDTLWAAIPNRYSLDEAQEAEFDEIETVLNTVRPNLEAGTLLSRLPEATLDSLLYWQNDCTEAGVLARAILWRNGQNLLTDCGGAPPAARPGNGQQPFATPFEPTETPLVRWYPNPSQGAINVELPSGFGPANAVFYNLQGKAIWRLILSEGKAQLQLPSYRFRPGIYLIETRFAGGQREYGKLILTN